MSAVRVSSRFRRFLGKSPSKESGDKEMFTQSRRIGLTTCLALAGLASNSPAKADWIVGGTQFASNYFTDVVLSITVPPAPTVMSGAVSNLWAGIEDAQGSWVLQPVLSYGFLAEAWQMENVVTGPSNGNPNNTSCITGDAQYCDAPITVSTGDQIVMQIELDTNNLGPNCNQSTGAKCNYNVEWLDFTSGASSVLQDWTQPTPLIWAQGLIFEDGISTHMGLPPPSSCNDYPVTLVSANVALYEKVGSNFFHQDVTNMTADNPGTAPFSNDTGCFFEAATSGQNVQMLLY
jgi:hypothetical protein